MATVFLVLLSVAELLTVFGDPLIGVGLHVALLGVVLLASVADADPRRHAFYLVLAFGPLIRIVSTGMPLPVFPQEEWYLLTSVPLFATAYVIVRLLNLSPRSIGLRLPERRYLPLELLVVASGLVLGVMEWLILRPSLLVPSHSPVALLGGALILLVGTGLMEELLFRGLIQYAACRLFGLAPGILFSATIFAVLHIGHRSAVDVVFVALVGLYFSVIVRYTRSLLGVTLAHGTINTMLFIVLPLLVPHG
jgi:membrane protease YdiL (CAAX protease family)